MNWATLITELRSFTGTTSVNYSDTLALIDLNKSYHYIEDLITQEVGESYFYQEFISDPLVSWQKEYTLPTNLSGNLDWVNKTLGVSIDYGNGYVKATKVDVNSLDKDVSWYMEQQSTASPIYTIQDNSVMIFPVATATTVWTYKLYVVQNLIDLTASTAETDVFNGKIHKKYHPLIALGAEEYCYIRRQQKQEAQEARNRFLSALFWTGNIPWMLSMINTRLRGARIRQMPVWYEVKQ